MHGDLGRSPTPPETESLNLAPPIAVYFKEEGKYPKQSKNKQTTTTFPRTSGNCFLVLFPNLGFTLTPTRWNVCFWEGLGLRTSENSGTYFILSSAMCGISPSSSFLPYSAEHLKSLNTVWKPECLDVTQLCALQLKISRASPVTQRGGVGQLPPGNPG